MKKISILLLVFSLLFTACSNTVSREDTTLIPFTSQNGYEITYPDTLSPVSLSSDIDFVVMDDNTGSSVTVMTENTEDAGDITEKSFCDGKLSDGMDIKITSFEQKEINGLPAYEVTYKYKENTVTEIIYMAQKCIYRATYTELPGTSDKLHEQMIAIITSLCA
ncbi:MAG: hypothetical protein IJC42_03555 [Oscillospiraceae bacterium]|nr:hypothetical protein [Oscillospiraceae bacterium]